MSDPVILGYRDAGNGMVEVTFGTVDYGQAVCLVPKEATEDPGFLQMLRQLHDRQRSINTIPRRSANPRK